MPGGAGAAADPAKSYPPSKILDVPSEIQCKGTWCYASVSQSIIQFLTGENISQEDVVNGVIETGGAKNKKNMGDPYKYLDSLGVVKDSIESSGPPSWSLIVTEINKGHPIIAKVGIHYIIIIGYEGLKGTDKSRRLHFIDPLTGRIALYATDTLHGEEHYTTGFPTGAAAAAASGKKTIRPADITRESWKGYILTKKPDEKKEGGFRKTRRTRRRRSSRRASRRT